MRLMDGLSTSMRGNRRLLNRAGALPIAKYVNLLNAIIFPFSLRGFVLFTCYLFVFDFFCSLCKLDTHFPSFRGAFVVVPPLRRFSDRSQISGFVEN